MAKGQPAKATQATSQSSSKEPSKKLVSVFNDPPRKNVFLLTCMDQRLLDETVRFMNALNMHNRYDQLAVAGSAMGIVQLPKPNPRAAASWWNLFTSHLSAAINKLHRPITDVFLVDHLDCGAYKELHPVSSVKEQYAKASLEEMREFHAKELTTLAGWVRTYCAKQAAEADNEELVKTWTEIRVSKFVIDLRGRIKQLDVPEHEQSTFDP